MINWYLIFLLLFFGCTKKELSKEEYLRFVESSESGLKVEKDLAEFKFILQYKPVEYMAIKATGSIERKDLLDFSELQYFNLRIEAPGHNKEMLEVGIRSPQEYFGRIEYFNSMAQEDLKLIDGNDTLDCVLYHFERSYNLAPFNNIVLGFPKTKNILEDKVVAYEDKVLGVGKVKMKIEKKRLVELSEIKVIN